MISKIFKMSYFLLEDLILTLLNQKHNLFLFFKEKWRP